MGWTLYKKISDEEYEVVEDVVDENTGRARFPSNMGDKTITYKIVYEGGDGAKCEKIFQQLADSCPFTYTESQEEPPIDGGRFIFGTLSSVGESTEITVTVKTGASYFTEPLTVDGNNVVGTLSPNGGKSGRTIKYIIKSNGNECETHEAYQPGKACRCTCSDITKEKNEKGAPFYTYTLSQQSHVPFAILTTSQDFECEVTASSYDIQVINCSVYNDSEWSSASSDFRTKCQELIGTGRKVWIVYGDLAEASQSTALEFTYGTCDNECFDKSDTGEDIPFYVFQRCACGMDNCRNEYQTEIDLPVIEDRPLYVSSCGNGWCLNGSDAGCSDDIPYWGWIQSDSICVEYLEFSGATKYLIEHNQSDPGGAGTKRRVGRVDGLGDNKITLCNGYVDPSTGDYRVKLNTTYQCTYSENHTKQNGYRNGDSQTGGKLITVDTNHNNTFESDVADFYMYLLRTGSGSYQPYDPSTNAYPLNAMCQYMLNATPISPSNGKITEQMWELVFTTTSDKIIGGGDHNKCALKVFKCVLYKAPLGYRYVEDPDNKYLKKLQAC